MTMYHERRHRKVVIRNFKIQKLYCFMMENGYYPDEEEVTECISVFARRDMDVVYEGRREPRYKSKAWVITPAPVFRTPDDFGFPPNSPERRRLEEVRRGIRERWELSERRAWRRGYWNVYSPKDNKDLAYQDMDFSMLSDGALDKLVDDIEETEFRRRKRRWSARSRKEKERIVYDFFQNKKTRITNQ